MKNSRLFKRVAKSSGARALAMLAVILLALEPYAFALNQIVDRFPTGYTAGSVDMGGGNLLPYGSVFDFNSAKSLAGGDASFASIREGACVPEATSYTFGSGMEGWAGTPVTDVVYSQTLAMGSGALKVALGKTNRSRAFTLEKKFFYDCGTPTAVNFAIKYSRGTWNLPGAQADNNFRVELVKPSLATVPLIGTVATPIQITADNLTAGSLVSAWSAAADLTEVGTYTLRIAGNLRTSTSGGSRVEVIFDDIGLSKASSYESFKTDVEFTLAATPYKSATGTYKLDLRARRAAGDTENTSVQVWNGSTWTTRYTVSSDTFTTYDSYLLTDAEYNGGTVRVRFVDATPTSDLTQGGVDVAYLRVTVDQGVCVDQVQDTASDCGKCHNYGGDITKPWPLQGMHNKHAQSESASDCLWCHVNNGSDSGHRNGGQIELGGTKVYRLGGANPNGAAATYDTATGRCSSVDCHKGIQTPAWTATYGLTQGAIDGVTVIARNCSRCHNSGTPGADTYTGPSGNYAPNLTDYNLDKAWFNDAGQGHLKHDAAFTINALSCATAGSCHPNNIGQHSVVGDGNIEVKMSPAYASPNKVVKYYPATKTCANVACHGGQQTPAFNQANVPAGTGPIDVATQCDKCHIAEQASIWGLSAGNASQWNSAISGLHRGGPPTSEITHTGLTANTCRDCHNLPVKHFREGGAGTNSNLHTTDMDLLTAPDFKALPAVTLGSGGTRPNWTTPTSCSIAAGTTGCHTESNATYRNPATSWARKWTWDAFSATEADRCKNCHGTWGSFVNGVSTPHAAKGGIGGVLHLNHLDNGKFCGTMCHATNDDGVSGYSHGVAPTATSKTIDININAGWVDNDPASTAANTTVGCGFCHASNDSTDPLAAGKHVFQETGWTHTSPQPNGPTPTCANDTAGCHGNVAGNKYWPDGVSTYPDKAGKHDMHMTRLAAKLYSESLVQLVTTTGNGTADAKQKAICVYCHNTLSPGLSGHTSDGAAGQAEVSSFKRIWDGTADGGTAGTFAAADGSCSNIDCHNNKATSTTYGWRSAATSTCLMCHNNDGTGTNNPTSGLHFGTLTVSANTHDDNFQITKGGASTATCTTCHTATPSTAHINGTFTNSAPTINFAATVGFTDAATPTCTPNGALSTCHSDGGTWSRLWSTTAKNSNGTECANCHGGFSGTDWTFGVGAALNNTTDNNVSHSRDWDGDTTANETYGNHSGNTANTNKCNTCHVYGDPNYVWGTHHNNGSIQMNSTTSYSTTNRNCTVTCHANNTGHNLEASGWTVTTLAGPAMSCTGCHGGASPAAGVSSSSPHVIRGTKAGYNTFNACTDCHPGGTKGAQHAKSGHANVMLIPNYATAGINYVSGANGYTGDNGIVLGGDATAAVTSEAEICWNCHNNLTYQNVAISEWGPNTATTGQVAITGITKATSAVVTTATPNTKLVVGESVQFFIGSGMVELDRQIGKVTAVTSTTFTVSINTSTYTTFASGNSFWAKAYDYGTLNQSNWIGATWTSGQSTQFAYKTGAIRSTHTANPSGAPWNGPTAAGVDTVGQIRCTYCHDVHSNNRAAGDTMSGKPFLRGTWMGNPYREDGAPRASAGQTIVATGTFGNVPRSGTAAFAFGGYQIDQNNLNPTTGGSPAHTTAVNATWQLSNSAGLCTMCHGTGVDSMNQFGTTADAWVGTNGHSNAAIGGTGSARANIFTMSGTSGSGNNTIEGRFASATTPALYTGSGTYRGAPRQSYLNAGIVTVDTAVLGDNTSKQRGYGFRSQDNAGYMFTPQVTAGSPYAYESYNWGAHVDDSAAQTLYHKFSCSKCHNPHASRLPRLMISNCLDTKQNTWDDALSTISGTGVSTENASAKIAQITSAQNCHRLKYTAQGAGARGLGWNRVTPWNISTGNPDNSVP